MEKNENFQEQSDAGEGRHDISQFDQQIQVSFHDGDHSQQREEKFP